MTWTVDLAEVAAISVRIFSVTVAVEVEIETSSVCRSIDTCVLL